MRRGESIESILQRCLARIAAGESVAACLHDHPEHADELAPLLEAVAKLRGWAPPTLSDRARAAARARAHAALAARRAPPLRPLGVGLGRRHAAGTGLRADAPSVASAR